jgi:type III pantothenate kinase
MPAHVASPLIAVDIGNSRIKLGRFEFNRSQQALPEPSATFHLAVIDRSGQFDAVRLADWSAEHSVDSATWQIASVHRGAAERLIKVLSDTMAASLARTHFRQLTYQDLPMRIDVAEPERVGIDRLLAAFAADRLRRRDRAAIVVDLGTAMTIDRVNADGAFAGGAILPGIAMAARALSEQTDALPRVGVESLDAPPAPLGKSTAAAIEAGLYWGAVGAIREFMARFSTNERLPPDVFLTGGASAQVAGLLRDSSRPADLTSQVEPVPHLVLAGIALAHQASLR